MRSTHFLFVRIVFVMCFYCSVIFSQNLINEVDQNLVGDTIVQVKSENIDKNNQNPQVISAKDNQPLLNVNQNKIRYFGEASIGNIWCHYDIFPDFWRYTYRIGFGVAGGVAINLKKPFRFRAGLRLNQLGNKINISADVYDVNYDTITWEPIDSQLVYVRGYFTQTQYLLSLPIFVDVFLKDIPVYIIAGFEPSYMVSASSYSELFENGIERPLEPDDDERSDYKNFNFVINNGIGIQIDHKNNFHSEVQLVFAWGLFNINDPDKWGVNFKTRDVSLRYLFLF